MIQYPRRRESHEENHCGTAGRAAAGLPGRERRGGEDGICARLTQAEGDCVWEFYRCLYDADEARLYAPNYTRYREYIDWDTMELVQEDWALGDLGLTWFAFADDDDALIACEVPEVDEPITLSRGSEEEDFGF